MLELLLIALYDIVANVPYICAAITSPLIASIARDRPSSSGLFMAKVGYAFHP
ncbi:hypothetical protein YN1HA_5330 [Sulfurisphaera ohwakuensis]